MINRNDEWKVLVEINFTDLCRVVDDMCALSSIKSVLGLGDNTSNEVVVNIVSQMAADIRRGRCRNAA